MQNINELAFVCPVRIVIKLENAFLYLGFSVKRNKDELLKLYAVYVLRYWM